MRYRKESIVITLLIVSVILGVGPWPRVAQAMDCTADAFNAIGLTDEEFGMTVTGITTSMTSNISYATSPPTVIEYCDVKGVIWPEITFEVMLPTTTWNQRLYMAGNSGTTGYIPTDPMVKALLQGYASTGTDTGHDADAKARSVHETVVLAKKIIQAYYGSATVYSYWVGCSTGGRQGLKEAHEYPNDFDGIIVGAPVINRIIMLGPAYLNPQAPTGSQSQIPPDKLPMLGTAVYDKCDGIDGLVDGIIDDPRNCTFDPDQDLQKCPGDIDGPACFTIAQITAIKKIYSGALSNGTLIVPGILKGSEAFQYGQGWYGSFVDKTLEQTQRYQTTSNSFKTLILSGTFPPDYDFLTQWNWDTDPAKISADAVDPDLSAFKAHGGKMLMYHGWADPGPNPLATSLDYFNGVQNFMGDQTKDVLAFYMVPGMGHCGGGVGCGKVDWFTPLVNWVENGIEPGSLIGSSMTSLARTRPICRYPEVARYSGTGDVNDAANFMCVPPTDFSLSPIAPSTVGVGGSSSSTVTVNSISGLNSPVDLSISGLLSGISAPFTPNPVTLPSGSSASSTLTVSLAPFVIPSTFTLTVTGISGSVTHSTPVTVTVIATSASTTDVIGQLLTTGCINNSGIANALTSKLSDAQTAISAGNINTAINILSAFINQVQTQSGKHIESSCTVGGVTFNAAAVLISDVTALINSLKVSAIPNPITGYIVDSSGSGISGATASIVDSAGSVVATTTTDVTGFYFFATTGVLTTYSTYTVQVNAEGFTTSTPASQIFTWQGTALTL